LKTGEKLRIAFAAASAVGSLGFLVLYLKKGVLLPVAVGVQDAVTKEPLLFAKVVVGSQVLPTDANGEAVFAGVPEGKATMTATSDGYQTVSETVDISPAADSFLVSLTPA